MSKQLSALALMLTAILALSACGDASGDTKTTEAATTLPEGETAPVTEAYDGPILPEANYNGETFAFYNSCMCDWMAIHRVTADEETGDTLNDAVYRRNLAVSDQYNIEISEFQNATDAQKSALNLISAGDTTYSIFLLREEPAFNIVLQNGAIDFADIPHLNLDREWWLQSSLESMSIDHRNFFGISTFDTTHYDGTSTIYFNKTLIDNFDLEDPYELVNSGKWTIDKMSEMAMEVAADLNGDGKWDEADRYGYTSHEILVARFLMAGMDAPLSLSKDENDMLYYDMASDFYIERLLKASEIIAQEDGFYHPKATSANHGGYEYFLSGNVLFYNETLGNAQKLRQMTLDFGILPAPKFNEAQEGYHNDVIEAYFMLVPATNPDLDRTGVIMEALAYESLDTVMVSAYDGMLQGIVSRDTESEAMLDLIFDTLSYNHPVAFQNTTTNMYTRIFNGRTDHASFTEKMRSKVEAAIEKALDAYQENN